MKQSLLKNSRELRRNMTFAETIIWNKIRNKSRGVRFWRQYVFDEKYIVDFYCASPKLVIEIDGGQHNENPKDAIRDEYLKQRGCKVLRFWNNEIIENINGCLEIITKELNSV